MNDEATTPAVEEEAPVMPGTEMPAAEGDMTEEKKEEEGGEEAPAE